MWCRCCTTVVSSPSSAVQDARCTAAAPTGPNPARAGQKNKRDCPSCRRAWPTGRPYEESSPSQPTARSRGVLPITNQGLPRGRVHAFQGFCSPPAVDRSGSDGLIARTATRENSGRRVRPCRFRRRVLDENLRPLPDLLSHTSRSCSRASGAGFGRRERTREMTTTARMRRWGSPLVFWNRAAGVIGGS